MEILEVSGKTVDEAIEKALDQLGVNREDIKVTVISEGKDGGLFGLGSEDAVISVEVLDTDSASGTSGMSADEVHAIARSTLEELLGLLEIDGSVVKSDYPDDSGEPNSAPIAYNIEGDDLGILIGRRGQTLSSLQYLLRLIVGHKTDSWAPIIVDAEGYKQRRYVAIQNLATRIADNVKTKGTPFTLEPMPAYERRIVHMSLANHSAVYTESIGEGESRKVVIKPKKPSGQRGNNNGQRNGNSHNSRSSFNRW